MLDTGRWREIPQDGESSDDPKRDQSPREISPREKRETKNELWLKNYACRESTKVASLAKKRDKENWNQINRQKKIERKKREKKRNFNRWKERAETLKRLTRSLTPPLPTTLYPPQNVKKHNIWVRLKQYTRDSLILWAIPGKKTRKKFQCQVISRKKSYSKNIYL